MLNKKEISKLTDRELKALHIKTCNEVLKRAREKAIRKKLESDKGFRRNL